MKQLRKEARALTTSLEEALEAERGRYHPRYKKVKRLERILDWANFRLDRRIKKYKDMFL